MLLHPKSLLDEFSQAARFSWAAQIAEPTRGRRGSTRGSPVAGSSAKQSHQDSCDQSFVSQPYTCSASPFLFRIFAIWIVPSNLLFLAHWSLSSDNVGCCKSRQSVDFIKYKFIASKIEKLYRERGPEEIV